MSSPAKAGDPVSQSGCGVLDAPPSRGMTADRPYRRFAFLLFFAGAFAFDLPFTAVRALARLAAFFGRAAFAAGLAAFAGAAFFTLRRRLLAISAPRTISSSFAHTID